MYDGREALEFLGPGIRALSGMVAYCSRSLAGAPRGRSRCQRARPRPPGPPSEQAGAGQDWPGWAGAGQDYITLYSLIMLYYVISYHIIT